MPAPINYMQYMPQVDLAQKFGQGFAIGNAIQNAPIQREAAQLQNQAVQQELQQRELLLQKQEKYKQDLEGYWNNPTVEGAARLSTEHPEHAQVIKNSWEALDTKAKETELKTAVPIYSALLNGNKTVALDLVNRQIDATKNANQDPSSLEAYRDMIESDPKAALAYGGTYLSTIQGADKFAKTFGELQSVESLPLQQGKIISEINLNQAKTQNEFSDIEIKKEANRLKALEAQYKREDNGLKREELKLKIDEAKQKITDKKLEKQNEFDGAIKSVDSTSGLLQEILSDKDSLFAASGLGAFRGAIPGTKARAMAGKIEQLQNALAFENLGALKGAMSDKDVAFLKNISSNLDRYQDEDLLVKELEKVGTILNKAKIDLPKKYGKLPEAQGAVNRGASGSFGNAKNQNTLVRPPDVSQAEWDQYRADRGYK